MPAPGPQVFHESAVRAARQIVAPVVEGLRAELAPMPEVEVDALPGRPVDVLVDEARHAEALVVGHRGRGAVASAFLGLDEPGMHPPRTLSGDRRPRHRPAPVGFGDRPLTRSRRSTAGSSTTSGPSPRERSVSVATSRSPVRSVPK